MATTLASIRQQVRARLVETLALTRPAAPIIGQQGTPGTTTITYSVVAVNATGTTEASQATTTTTSAATLTGVNYNQINWQLVPGADFYRVYRTATNGVSPTTLGLVGSVIALTFNDTGVAGDGTTPPSVNTSGIAAPFWTEDELLQLIIAGCKDLWKAIVDLHQGHFVRFVDSTSTPVGTLTLPAGVSSRMTFMTGVPTDCFRIMNIEPENLTNSNASGLIRYFKPSQMNSRDFQAARAMTIQDSGSYLTIFYDILNAGSPVAAPQIVTAPPVSSAIALRLMYVYTLPTLLDTDNNPIPGESDNALIAWTVAYAKAKEQETEQRVPDPGWLAIYNTEKQGLLVALTPRQEQEEEVAEGLFEGTDGGWVVSIIITVKTLGQKGVNVDNDPFDLENDQLTQAQNAISDPQKGRSAIRKRAGFIDFNTLTLSYDVLGGSPLPGPNLSSGGDVTIYIGRGPVA